MHAMRQSCRPKHQVLILKCYPRFQKNALDVKPNSSELSYLLYYASTRKSKLQKVGAFLEKRTLSDVSRGRIGNVQVTLQILKALVEKLPRDLALYAQFTLRILASVLRSRDLTLVEDSIPLFETFCRHYDVATLAADQEHIGQYEGIVQMYAGFAAQSPPVQVRSALSKPVAIRWRGAGLLALKSITASEAVGADGGRQLKIIMPVILQNLHPEDEEHLIVLRQRIQTMEDNEREMSHRRRSNATIQTMDGSAENNAAVLSGTADDADRIAEQEVGRLALVCLKQIFVANNRLQIMLATASLLRFICVDVPQRKPQTGSSLKSGRAGSWTTTLVEMVTRWAPVQDRFIILVTTMETLVRSPIAEGNLKQQLVLATLVGWLLKSSINMIGLSVMDVLLGLVQHILLLLQLGGRGSNVRPHHQQSDAIGLFQDIKDVLDQPLPMDREEKTETVTEEHLPSTNRQELLTRLQKCIGDLATHIYYSDQISDIITAILLRLKPSPMSAVSTDAAAIEHPRAAARAISTSVNLQENPKTDNFFSFDTARVTALKAVKEVLIVANMRSSVTGAAAIGRNRVSVQGWEGTQWLLRDEDRRVRQAYVDALLTWLKLEMSKSDLRVMEDKRKLIKTLSKLDGDSGVLGPLTRRAVSNASQREKPGKPAPSTFLHLLHLAIYDNAIESPDSEPELLLLHLLLVNLVEKLGVNAVKTGLPMIMRLQEDINIDDLVPTPVAKLNIGSLVHGYLWTLSERFDFDTSRVGHEIHSEISRRRTHKLWLDSVRVPPLPLDQIILPASLPLSEKPPLLVLQTEALKPFDSRASLVGRIAESYASVIASSPTSPPSSPGRVFSMPILSSAGPSQSSDNELPNRIKDAMLSDWSKDICIATVEKETRTVSLNGSRTGTNLSNRQKNLAPNGWSTRNGSPTGSQSPAQVSPPNDENQQSSQIHALIFPFQTQQENRLRRSSAVNTNSPTPISSSDQNQTLRVDDLKRVLAGGPLTGVFNKTRNASPLRNSTVRTDFAEARGETSTSTSGDSAVGAEGYESANEGDPTRPVQSSRIRENNTNSTNPAPAGPLTARPSSSRRSSDLHHRSSLRPRSSSSNSLSAEDPISNAKALRGDLVPSLPLHSPSTISTGTNGNDPSSSATAAEEDDVPPVPPLPREVALRGGLQGGVIGGLQKGSLRKKRGLDVGALLGSIDAVAGDGSGTAGNVGGVRKPPY